MGPRTGIEAFVSNNLESSKLSTAQVAVQDIRAKLVCAGYLPLAVHGPNATVNSPGKQPKGKAWQERARQIPSEAATVTPDLTALNTGILCDGLRAIDIDIDDLDLATEVIELAYSLLGKAPIRHREHSARCLILYRAFEGEPGKRLIKGSLGAVEVLGRGQQFVAYGTHASGADYLWKPANFATRNRTELIAVSEQAISTFLEAVAVILAVDGSKPNGSEDKYAAEPPNRSASRNMPTDYERSHASRSLDQIVAKLSAMPARSGRNQALNNAALGLGEMISSGWLDQGVVQQALWQACNDNGYRAKDGNTQVKATIHSGLEAGKLKPREPMLDLDRITCKGKPLASFANEAFDNVVHGEVTVPVSPTLGKRDSGTPSVLALPALKVDTLEYFTSLVLPARQHLLTPIISRRSLAMLYAPRGVGKTHVVMGMAYAIASGGSFLRWQAPGPRKVIVVDGEMPAELLQQRVRRLSGCGARPVPPGYFSILAMDRQELGVSLNLALPRDQERVEANLGDAEFLVLDNISTLVSGGRENDAESWDSMQAWLLHLRRRAVSVLLVAHAGRGENARGTSKREDVLDCVSSEQLGPLRA
jgi:hypothetical protein